MTAKKTTIYIIGGGIGGLTLADELSQYSSARVVLLERNQRIGGKVQCYSTPGQGFLRPHAPFNYSPYYEFFFDQLKNIPSGDADDVERHNVFTDHMVEIKQNTITYAGKEIAALSTGTSKKPRKRLIRLRKLLHAFKQVKLSTAATLSILFKNLSVLFMTEQQRQALHKINYKDFINHPNEDFFGLIETVSAVDVSGSALASSEQFLKQVLGVFNPHNVSYATRTWNKTSSEALFKPWYRKLRKQDVEIHTGKKCVQLQTQGKRIVGIVTQQANGKQEKVIPVAENDIVALATNLSNTHQLVQDSALKNVRLPRLKESLKKAAGYYYVLNGIPEYLPINQWIVPLGSPWSLLAMCVTKDFVDYGYHDKYPTPTAMLWVAMSNEHQVGQTIKKKFTECTEKEIAQEILTQLHFDERYVLHSFPGTGFDPDNKVFPTLYTLPVNPIVVPSSTPYTNLFLGASVVHTRQKVPTQEKAVEGSRKCAAAILKHLKTHYPLKRYTETNMYYTGSSLSRAILYSTICFFERTFRLLAKVPLLNRL